MAMASPHIRIVLVSTVDDWYYPSRFVREGTVYAGAVSRISW
jgi:hypothetical protein